MSAAIVDELVGRQVLQVLEPAALELALEAEARIQREQDRLEKHWQQELERAQYRTRRARCQYDAVEPENRLVARELERHWEQALLAERKAQEEYDRFQQTHPKDLSAADRQRILALSTDIPALWKSSSTSAAERQEIIRQLVDKVVVHAQGKTEVVDVTASLLPPNGVRRRWEPHFPLSARNRRSPLGYASPEKAPEVDQALVKMGGFAQKVSVESRIIDITGIVFPAYRPCPLKYETAAGRPMAKFSSAHPSEG